MHPSLISNAQRLQTLIVQNYNPGFILNNNTRLVENALQWLSQHGLLTLSLCYTKEPRPPGFVVQARELIVRPGVESQPSFNWGEAGAWAEHVGSPHLKHVHFDLRRQPPDMQYRHFDEKIDLLRAIRSGLPQRTGGNPASMDNVLTFGSSSSPATALCWIPIEGAFPRNQCRCVRITPHRCDRCAQLGRFSSILHPGERRSQTRRVTRECCAPAASRLRGVDFRQRFAATATPGAGPSNRQPSATSRASASVRLRMSRTRLWVGRVSMAFCHASSLCCSIRPLAIGSYIGISVSTGPKRTFVFNQSTSGPIVSVRRFNDCRAPSISRTSSHGPTLPKCEPSITHRQTVVGYHGCLFTAA